MYFGGLWGGQLEKWRTGTFEPKGAEPKGSEPALGPKVAKMAGDMLGFAGPIEEVAIVDQDGQPLQAKDHERRFFEGWVPTVGIVNPNNFETPGNFRATSARPVPREGDVIPPRRTGWRSEGGWLKRKPSS